MHPRELEKLIGLLKRSDLMSRKKAIPFETPNLVELEQLLADLQITNRFAQTRYGDFWKVNSHPFSGKDKDHADILLTIRTNNPANQCLAEGLAFMLQNENGNYWLSKGITDDCGQVWFKDLRLGSYHAEFDSRELLDVLPSTQQVNILAAAQVEDDIIKIYLDGSHLYACLEKGDEEEAVLYIYGDLPKYKNATVFYKIGNEYGEVVLTRSGDLWTAVRYMSQRFADVKDSIPQFTIVPPK